MDIANKWKDYEILDMASGEKLERWKNVILVRPDPQIIWSKKSYPQIAVIMCITSVLVSKIGFSNLVSILYPIFGYLGILQIYKIFTLKNV